MIECVTGHSRNHILCILCSIGKPQKTRGLSKKIDSISNLYTMQK